MKVEIVVNSETGVVEKLGAWHPFNGEWVYIEQILKDDKMIYMTGGFVSGTADIESVEVERTDG